MTTSIALALISHALGIVQCQRKALLGAVLPQGAAFPGWIERAKGTERFTLAADF